MLDASTLVSATFNRSGVPALAVEHAFATDRVAISEPVMTELLDVLHRPKVARFIRPDRRSELLGQLLALCLRVQPGERVTDCRDPKDDKYLELALAARAEQIVSSDADLLMLHPWRGIRVLRPAEYLAEVGRGA